MARKKNKKLEECIREKLPPKGSSELKGRGTYMKKRSEAMQTCKSGGSKETEDKDVDESRRIIAEIEENLKIYRALKQGSREYCTLCDKMQNLARKGLSITQNAMEKAGSDILKKRLEKLNNMFAGYYGEFDEDFKDYCLA